MTDEVPSATSIRALSILLRRETSILILLGMVTIPLFFFTRTMASRNRQKNAAFGRAWYERALESMKQDDLDGAIENLRKASAADRDNTNYSLVLAENLHSAGQSEEARQILLRLRNSKPDDGRINLDLARISAPDEDPDETRRYYHQALYGLWPKADLEAQQTKTRLELVNFLVARQDVTNAVSELLILASNEYSDAETRVKLGFLFLRVDEPSRALRQFAEALKLSPMNAMALAGAGEAEFKLGNDAAAVARLEYAASQNALSTEAQHTLNLASLILATDPLTNGITPKERTRRVGQVLLRARERLDLCRNKSALLNTDMALSLGAEAIRMEQQISREKTVTDLDLLRHGLSIAFKMEISGTPECGPRSDADEAIVLSAGRHKLDTP